MSALLRTSPHIRRTLTAATIAVTLALTTGCSALRYPMGEENVVGEKPEIAAAAIASSDNIKDAWVELDLDGLGRNLLVYFDTERPDITAEELQGLFAAVAPMVPSRAVVVIIDGTGPNGEPLPIAEAARELGVDELDIYERGERLSLHPKTLAELGGWAPGQ